MQEALTNVTKHSGARTVWVTVATSLSQISVEVCDDGSGFDTAAATSGYGLAGMRERVYIVGGTFEISSDPASGTCIRATLPVRPVSAALRRGAGGQPAA